MSSRFNIYKLSLGNKIARSIWRIFWLLLFRPTPRIMPPWRCILLKLFGAKLGVGVHVYPSAAVWAPWNLEMDDYACLSEHVDCYSVGKIRIGKRSIISQYSFLCTASHDYSLRSMPLVTGSINIGESAWITADVFIGPGVSIGDGTVVTARSSVFEDLPPWTIVGGNPAIVKGFRTIQ